MTRLRLLSAILAFFIFGALCFAQEEKISVTTYYPSPYGEYNIMQLNILYAVPQGPGTVCKQEGQLFYDLAKHILMVCNDQFNPVPVGGRLGSEIVPCTATSMTANNFSGWGCTATCPSGTRAIGGGADWGAVIAMHKTTYSKPTNAGDGWMCFISPALPGDFASAANRNELIAKGFNGGANGCGVGVDGKDVLCDGKIFCYAACGKME